MSDRVSGPDWYLDEALRLAGKLADAHKFDQTQYKQLPDGAKDFVDMADRLAILVRILDSLASRGELPKRWTEHA